MQVEKKQIDWEQDPLVGRSVRMPKSAAPIAPAKKTSPKPPRRNPGVVDQVRIACSRQHRLATTIGAALGAVVPLATYSVAHYELAWSGAWYLQPQLAIVLGGLAYSARTVYQWGKLAFLSAWKAAGFVLLLEGVMVGSAQPWLAITALVYLCAINAIATGVTLARGAAPRE